MARRRRAVRQRLTDWKDSVFGNDESQYPPYRGWADEESMYWTEPGQGGDDGLLDRGRQRSAEASSVRERS